MIIKSVGHVLKASALALVISHSSVAAGKVIQKTQFASRPIEQKFIPRNNNATALINKTADYFEHVQLAQNKTSGIKKTAKSTKSKITHKTPQTKLRIPIFSNTKRIGESKKSWIYEFTNFSNFTQADTTKFNRVTWAVSKTNLDNRISRYDFKPVKDQFRSVIFGDSTRTLYMDHKGGFVEVEEVRKSNKYSLRIQNDAGAILKKTYNKNMLSGEIENLERTVVLPGTNEELLIEQDLEYNAVYKGIFKPYEDLHNIKEPGDKINELNDKINNPEDKIDDLNNKLKKLDKHLKDVEDEMKDAEDKAASKAPKFGLG